MKQPPPPRCPRCGAAVPERPALAVLLEPMPCCGARLTGAEAAHLVVAGRLGEIPQPPD